ncbi:RNA polymerase sigma factor [Bacillus sp. RO2]|jgi:RNA polymerase sigma-70 factor (ECF subfamily)|uniref:RNA polymerase sigma factor n=1 Tax=Bacillus sp. RO2 TaxID=2723913 RepID=UPI00145DC72D|nr:RNA polymerase sigma factor [Bacillus sp. RO2]NMH72005.1 RNA polymerase sigma factor [Bacillus sp. RO2]
MQNKDSLLYERIRKKDKTALEELYDRYEKILYSFLLKITNDHEIAEEAMQDVFIKIWQGTGIYDESKGKFRSWLFTIARNKALDIIRKQQRTQSAPLEDVEPFLQSNDSTEKETEWKEEQIVIREAVSTLSDDQRKMVHYMYFKGYTQQKIAELTGIPLGTVKGRIRLALKKLKPLLADRRGSI